MLCSNCSKLAILTSNRNCVRCKGSILNTLSCICDRCSTEQNICSICLKKILNPATFIRKSSKGGCRSCGGH